MNDLQVFANTIEHREGHLTLLWTMPGKTSFWVSDPDQMVSVAEANVDRSVYIGIGTSATDRGPNQRCASSEISGLYGVAIDVDITGPNHAKPNLPPDVEHALELVRLMPLKPTVLVHTGGGLQAWWLFHEHWELETEEERVLARQILYSWNYSAKYLAHDRGWDVDSTWDLARVYRLPGTMNCKDSANPTPVRILEINPEIRYDPSDFEDYLMDFDPVRNTGLTTGTFILNPGAKPDVDKFTALCEIEPKFKLSWERKRREKGFDQSGSGYDMSLASYATQAQWGDQEIVNLLIAHRRKHGDPPKMREDYYLRTLCRAKEHQQQPQQERKTKSEKLIAQRDREKEQRDAELVCELIAMDQNRQEIEKKAEEIHGASSREQTMQAVGEAAEADRRDTKNKKLDIIGEMLGVRITKILRIGSGETHADEYEFVLETPYGTTRLGDVQNLIEHRLFRRKVAQATMRVIPYIKPKVWDQLVQHMMDIAETQNVGGTSFSSLASEYLREFQEIRGEKVVVQENGQDNVNDLLSCRKTFVHGQNLVLFGDEFRAWLRVTRQEQVTNRVLALALKQAGCSRETRHISIDGKKSTRSIWNVPMSFLLQEDNRG